MSTILDLIVIGCCIGDIVVYIKQKKGIEDLKRQVRNINTALECKEFKIQIDKDTKEIEDIVKRIIRHSYQLGRSVNNSINPIVVSTDSNLQGDIKVNGIGHNPPPPKDFSKPEFPSRGVR